MKRIPINKEPKLVLVNSTMLASFDKEKCQYCGKYGCTDRGVTITAGDPPITFGEAEWGQQLMDKLTELVENSEIKDAVLVQNLTETQCVRKLKTSNAQAVLERLHQCDDSCRRNAEPCPFRKENLVCQIYRDVDQSPLICSADNEDFFDCEFHEHAFADCPHRNRDGSCGDPNEKLGFVEDNIMLMLSHRFSTAPCHFSKDGACTNPESLHFEGVCSLHGLMAPCDHYAAVDPDHNYTEGVCTYVSSLDGKDDRKIFNTSEYAYCLDRESATTLCAACRISHCIAKATGLKCLGVRRSSKNPLLNDKNPFKDNAIQINYLFLTHPEDVAKYNPDLLAQAVYEALRKNCKGIGCEEIETCNFYNS